MTSEQPTTKRPTTNLMRLKARFQFERRALKEFADQSPAWFTVMNRMDRLLDEYNGMKTREDVSD